MITFYGTNELVLLLINSIQLIFFNSHDNRIKEIAEMSITIGELEKSNQDLEDQIKR